MVGILPEKSTNWRLALRKTAEEQRNTHHVAVAADMSLHVQLRMGRYYMAHLPNDKCQLRIGVHTGPAVAGVIGTATPRYLLFGHTVQTARVMMENAKRKSGTYCPTL